MKKVTGWILPVLAFIALIALFFSSGNTKEERKDDVFGSPLSSLEEFDIDKYAESPHHENRVYSILKSMPTMQTKEDVDSYIRKSFPESPITGDMVIRSARRHLVNVHLILAIMRQDSGLGTKGKGARTRNPGNVGTYGIRVKSFRTWEEGVDAVAKWLKKHKKQRAGTQACRPFTFISQKFSQNLFYQTSLSFPFLFRYFLLSLLLISYLLQRLLLFFFRIHCLKEVVRF